MNLHAKRNYLASLLLITSLCGCTPEDPRVATRLNTEASLTGTLPWNPVQGRVITTWIDTRNATMSTLYGNDLAVEHVRASTGHAYPSGAIVSLVTWKQQEDERWFGANIPAAVQSVEFVTVRGAQDRGPEYSYQQFQGNPLRQTLAQQGSTPNDRTAYLLSQRPAPMP